MRKIDRSKKQALAPAVLSAKNKQGMTELECSRVHYAASDGHKKSFPFKAYKHDDIKKRLNEIFHYKCAYCETFFSASAPVDIEHYRPKSAVSEDHAHPGYWWLAMDWDNLLPSCIDCNRKRKQKTVDGSTRLSDLLENAMRGRHLSGKKDSFPLAEGGVRLQPEARDVGAEQPLLLNPYVDDPLQHLQFVSTGNPPVSLVVPGGEPTSAKGATSIHVYGLNRLGLVQERTRYLRRLEFLGEMLLSLGQLIDELNGMGLSPAQIQKIKPRLVFLLQKTGDEMKQMAAPEQPYSAMVASWIGNFYQQVERRGA